MLPKANRLHTFREIKSVQTGQTFFLPEFTIKYKKNSTGALKFGFVVSTKIDKRATVRNLLKRRMRAAVQELIGKNNGDYSVMISARPAAKGMEFAKIKKQLSFALSKIKVLK